MSEPHSTDDRLVSRRRALQAAGTTIGIVGLGAGQATAHQSDDDHRDCPAPSLESAMVHYDDSIRTACSDDHPESKALQADVKASLETQYPTVGALIDDGFFPYPDFFTDQGWSHWINPEYIGDDSMVDPERPESVLVDHRWWRPIGVMFIATDEGEPVDPPPTVYTDDDDENGGACTPWHAHIGLPGRYSWWSYRKAYQGRTGFPCRTPWMMHVWIHDHPVSIYAHAAPEDRGGSPAEPAGFETNADPTEESLGPEHLPDALRHKLDTLW